MGKKIKISVVKSIIILIIVFLLGILGGLTFIKYGGNCIIISEKYYQHITDIEEKYMKLEMLYDKIESDYYGEYTDEDLMTGLYKGLYSALDQYSLYMTPEEYESFAAKSTGSFYGVGVVVSTTVDDELIILSTISGAPAANAGLKPGDIIVAIDDELYSGSQLDLAAAKLRGEIGTKVKVKYLRNGETDTVTLTRAHIVTESVESSVIENNIGYIKITSFELATADDFKKAVKDLKQKNIEGLIIDLRNNGGGMLDASIEIADELLPSCTIISTMNSNGKEEYYNSDSNVIDLPYVLLVNNMSASASEVLAAAIKENDGGLIVGKTTFGKGVVQEMQIISDKGDAIKQTVMEYFGPNRTKINGVGVVPDYDVDYNSENDDAQLNKAIELLKNTVR